MSEETDQSLITQFKREYAERKRAELERALERGERDHEGQ
jgi:hypothetical protein